MSIKVVNWILDRSEARHCDLPILIAIAERADDDGHAFMGIEDIMRRARLTRRGAQKAVRRIEAAGQLAICTGGGRGGCNIYSVIMDDRAEKPRTEVRPLRACEIEKGRTLKQETANWSSPEPLEPIYSGNKLPEASPPENEPEAGQALEKSIDTVAQPETGIFSEDRAAPSATETSPGRDRPPEAEKPPVESFAKTLWDRGVAFLIRHGTPERQARGMIGRWRKTYSDSDIFDAFCAASREGVVDPIPWITARLQQGAGNGSIINLNSKQDYRHGQRHFDQSCQGGATGTLGPRGGAQRRLPQGSASQIAAAGARLGYFDEG